VLLGTHWESWEHIGNLKGTKEKWKKILPPLPPPPQKKLKRKKSKALWVHAKPSHWLHEMDGSNHRFQFLLKNQTGTRSDFWNRVWNFNQSFGFFLFFIFYFLSFFFLNQNLIGTKTLMVFFSKNWKKIRDFGGKKKKRKELKPMANPELTPN